MQRQPRPAHRRSGVTASTYSAVDDALWLLDEVRGPLGLGPKRARLVRIDRLTGTVSIVAQWPRLGIFQSYWLSMDRDGQLLLTVTRSNGQGKHGVFRIATSPSPHLTGVSWGTGELLEAPVVDRAGYTLILRPKIGSQTSFAVQRSSTLAMSPCGWGDLGAAL